jgi:Transcriptional activator of glycolytic enzymes
MFRFAPFNTPAFRSFAANSGSVVARAEEDARHALKNLPEQVAISFRGLATDIKMDQHVQRVANEARWDAMESRLEQLTGLLGMIAGSKASKGRKPKAGEWSTSSLASIVAHILFASAAVLPFLVPVQDIGPLMTTTQVPPSSSSSQPSAATAPNITINISNPSAGFPTATISPSAPPLPFSSLTNSSFEPSPATQTLTPKYQGQPMNAAQLVKWNALVEKYGDARVHKHQWEWVKGDFVPYYIYPSVGRITEYWAEWADGIGGFLSTRELTEAWGAKWRRNNGGQRTECGRRKKVTDLITMLSGRPNWSVNLALRFVSNKYEPLYTPRKFCDWLTAQNVQSVFVAAASFC